MIRRCADLDVAAIDAVINEAAQVSDDGARRPWPTEYVEEELKKGANADDRERNCRDQCDSRF